MAGRITPITAVAIIFFLVSAVAPLFVRELDDVVRADSRQGHRRARHRRCCCRPARSRSGTRCSSATGAYTAAFWGMYIGGGDILLFLVLGG